MKFQENTYPRVRWARIVVEVAVAEVVVVAETGTASYALGTMLSSLHG